MGHVAGGGAGRRESTPDFPLLLSTSSLPLRFLSPSFLRSKSSLNAGSKMSYSTGLAVYTCHVLELTVFISIQYVKRPAPGKCTPTPTIRWERMKERGKERKIKSDVPLLQECDLRVKGRCSRQGEKCRWGQI